MKIIVMMKQVASKDAILRINREGIWIEEGDLSAIGLVLEQFHHAVADRRVALNGTAPDMPRRRAL